MTAQQDEHFRQHNLQYLHRLAQEVRLTRTILPQEVVNIINRFEDGSFTSWEAMEQLGTWGLHCRE